MKKVFTLLLFILSLFPAFGQKEPASGPGSKEPPQPDLTDIHTLTVTTGLRPGTSAGPSSTQAISLNSSMVFKEEDINSPNNTSATATPLGGTSVKVRGSVFPNGDVDYYSFTANAGDRVYAATMTAFSASGSTDSQLSLIASDGTTVIEFDDNDGSLGGSSSSIAGAVIPTAGTYYLLVKHFSATNTLRSYDLYLKVQSGSPVPEVEGNDTPATANNAPASGWISGSRDPASASEVDYFALNLVAGETVFLSLDLDPERDGVTWNGRLGFALLGDANNQIVVVDDASTASLSNPLSEALFFTVKETGTYYLYVDSATPATGGPTATYNLSVSKLDAAPGYTSYTSADVPKTIGPGAGSVTSTITIPDTKRIKDLAVRITLNHDLMADIDAILTTPEGNQIALFTDIGAGATGGQTQMDVRFSDYNAIPPTFTVLRPVEIQPELNSKLDQLKGMKTNGTWTLTLYDDGANASGGTLTNWALDVLEDTTPATLATATTIYSQDFESGDGGFTHSGTADEWARGTPNTPATTTTNPVAAFTTANSGVNCWKTDLTGTYELSCDQTLESANIDLTAVTSNTITLSWAMKYQMESATFDNLEVYVEEVGGSGLTQNVFTWLGATQTVGVGSPTVNIGMSSGWGIYFADISAFKGKIIRLKIRLRSDTSINFGGVAIDDVIIYTALSCTTPVATISASPSTTLTCAQTSLTLTAGGGNAYAFSGPGVVSQSGNMAVVNASGVYSVTVTNTVGGCSSVTTITISQNASTPVATISAAPSTTLTCAQTSLTLTAGGGNAYAFSGPGVVSQSGNTAVVNAAGVYSVTVTNTTSGCFSTTSITISQDAGTPVATISASPSTTLTCTQTSLTLTAGGGNAYAFSPNVASQSGNMAVVNAAGVYSVTVTNTVSGCASVTSISISQNVGTPSVNITANPSLTITQGQSTTLTANVSGGTSPFTFGWSTGSNAPSIVASTGGPYSVTATGANGCSATATATVTVNPVISGPFAITGVTTLSCQTLSAGQRRVTFNPRYASQDSSPISFSVVNEMLPTTNPGPYTLDLYTDNSVITLSATQSGANTLFAYNWLSACSSSTGNTPPTVANPVPPQSATVGIGYTLSLATVFTDAETPNSLVLSVSGLPSGLNFVAPSTISGTPSVSGVSTVTVTATDPGSLSASTSFTITVNPAAGTPPPPSGTFSITSVQNISCQVLSVGQRRLTFNPQYAGVNGAPISFSVANEMAPTTNPGPYSLDLYTDNPVVTLQAVESGISSSFAYNWLAACSSSTANTPPTVANPVSPQSATVGVGYTLSLAMVFTDAETPNQLTLSVSGLPAGLNFVAPSTISGTPSMSGVSTVTVTATDPGSMSASTSFTITVNPAAGTPPPPTGTFSITGVTTVSCQVLSAGQRRLSFNPQYAGVNGQPISFSVVNEMLPTTAPGPYSLDLYTDNPVITLKAVQSGVASQFSYGWLAACNPGARQAARPVADSRLKVLVLSNPTDSETAQVVVSGVASQALWLRVVDERGHAVSQLALDGFDPGQVLRVGLGRGAGLYLLEVRTASQGQTVRILKGK